MPRRPKTNEIKYPYVVELAIVGDGLDVELNRRIIQFQQRSAKLFDEGASACQIGKANDNGFSAV